MAIFEAESFERIMECFMDEEYNRVVVPDDECFLDRERSIAVPVDLATIVEKWTLAMLCEW